MTLRQESILVISGHGVQLEKVYFGGRKVSQFIELDKIEKVIINEGFRSQDVIYYLAFIMKNQNKLILPFESIIPRLNHLIDIYKEIKPILQR